MFYQSLSFPRRPNRVAAALLSLALVGGAVSAASISAPIAFAQEAESGTNNSVNTGNGEEKDKDKQPEESSLNNSSVATDEESDLAKIINSLSLVLAVGGIAGAVVSLIAHFASMALPSVPWKN